MHEADPVPTSFTSSARATVGVEWELQIVDPATGDLVPAASDLLADLAGPDGSEHPKAKHELFESIVEILTGVCETVPEALADLSATVAQLEQVAGRRGLVLACAGTHPSARWQDQVISPNPRYAVLVEDKQWVARQLLITGVHVHVGVRSPDKVVPILNAVAAQLPLFLALSASSPFWAGADTGLASSRSKLFEQLPTAGLPYQFDDWAAFGDYLDTLVSAGAVGSIRDLWWDVRPHPDYGTVELRVCDGVATLAEVGMVAALYQCLVVSLDEALDAGRSLRCDVPWVVRENKWRAARYGLDARLVVENGRETVPVRTALLKLASQLAPVAERIGCADQLAAIPELVATGGGAGRQRAAAGSAVDTSAAVALLTREFAARRPL